MSLLAHPDLPLAYKTGKSNCSSLASKLTNKSNVSSITWFLAKRMASVKHLSLVNLIVGKEVVAELLQNNMKPKNIAKEINYLLSQEGKAARKQNHALLVNSIDTTRKNPYQNAAKYILQ